MAYKPSQRRSIETLPTEPNLTPIMNLMVVLIPLLLSSAEFVKLGAIELNLPPVVGPLVEPGALPVEGTKHLELSIFITKDSFVINSNISTEFERIKLKQSLSDLQEHLYEIKTYIPPYFREKESITIQASAGIKYQKLIDVIESVRVIKIKNEEIELFPDVKLSAGVL
ncbi:MAG: hypothetical protein DWQ10_04175 [Calditrichaeota bacterium]|nr:MAG: hypothetical protein DWQ10_04175 [Calditrichota bacterium]